MYQPSKGRSGVERRTSPSRSTGCGDRVTLEGGEQRLHAAEGGDGIGPAGEGEDPAPAGVDPTRSDIEPMEPELLELIGVPLRTQQQELEGLGQVVGDGSRIVTTCGRLCALMTNGLALGRALKIP